MRIYFFIKTGYFQLIPQEIAGRQVSFPFHSSPRFPLMIDTNKTVAGKAFCLSVARIKINRKIGSDWKVFFLVQIHDDAIMIFSLCPKSKQIASNYFDDDLFFYRVGEG